MQGLSKLLNIGSVLERQLEEVGITTYQQLAETGSIQAWLKIRAVDPSACINRLYALEGAILGVRKNLLPPDKKEELREFYNDFK